jgi:hypothetical protein
LPIEGAVRSPTWHTVIDERPARMPPKAHFGPPQSEPADPRFRPKNTDLMYNVFNGLWTVRIYNNCKLLVCRTLWARHSVSLWENDNPSYN